MDLTNEIVSFGEQKTQNSSKKVYRLVWIQGIIGTFFFEGEDGNAKTVTAE